MNFHKVSGFLWWECQVASLQIFIFVISSGSSLNWFISEKFKSYSEMSYPWETLFNFNQLWNAMKYFENCKKVWHQRETLEEYVLWDQCELILDNVMEIHMHFMVTLEFILGCDSAFFAQDAEVPNRWIRYDGPDAFPEFHDLPSV